MRLILPVSQINLRIFNGFVETTDNGQYDLRKGDMILRCPVNKPAGGREKEAFEMILDIIRTLEFIEVFPVVITAHQKGKKEISYTEARKILLKYLIMIHHNTFAVRVPDSTKTMWLRSLKVNGKSQSEQLYSMVKAMLLVALRSRTVCPENIFFSLRTTWDSYIAVASGNQKTSAGAVTHLAAAGDGLTQYESLLIIQASRDVLDANKLSKFLKSHYDRGFYIKGGENYLSLLDRLYKKSFKEGFVQMVFKVAAGVSYTMVTDALMRSGAMKRNMIYNLEHGFHDKMLEKRIVRVSEWQKVSGSLYSKAGSNDTKRFRQILGYVNIR